MGRTLVLTVGGSPQPLITSVKTLEPDRVVFVCSKGPRSSADQVLGEGNPCEVHQADGKKLRQPNLVKLLGWSEKFDKDRDIVLVEPDDPSDCYRTVAGLLRQCLTEGNEVAADYTGGTKTMSVALAMAAMDYGVRLYLTTGSRKDLSKVTQGERTEFVSTHLIDLDRKLDQFLPLFLSSFDYSSALDQLKGLVKALPLDIDSKKKIRRLQDLCGAFEAWDRFDHQTAWNLLEPYMSEPVLRRHGLYLKRIMQSRMEIDEKFQSTAGMRGHGLEVVEDLVLNAQRRESQSHYDDAVGRLYRAIELMVQIHLSRRYGIRTGDLDPGRLPEHARSKYEQLRFPHNQNRIRLGLRQSYELLELWTDDPLGTVYRQDLRKVEDILVTRNGSLFAHGFHPLSQDEYEPLKAKAESYIRRSIEACSPARSSFDLLQFPTAF